jgi:mRNA-degrading endonuclease HigB of HigAB toxin-antitoxin module
LTCIKSEQFSQCINYPSRTVFVKFVGTHKQYDEIDAQNI